jgi:hypothetical protein
VASFLVEEERLVEVAVLALAGIAAFTLARTKSELVLLDLSPNKLITNRFTSDQETEETLRCLMEVVDEIIRVYDSDLNSKI